MPKPENVDRAALAGKIDTRVIQAVIATLIDIDLRRVTHNLGLDADWFAHLAMFGPDRVGGPFLAQVLAKNAEPITDDALGQVKCGIRALGLAQGRTYTHSAQTQFPRDAPEGCPRHDARRAGRHDAVSRRPLTAGLPMITLCAAWQ